MNECPFLVEEKITAQDVQKICDDLQIEIVTTAELFMTDLNLYYAGYEHHKRLKPSTKGDAKCFGEVYQTSRRLIGHLKNLVNAEDSFFHERLNALLLLSHKQDLRKVRQKNELLKFENLPKSTIEIISTLEHLIKVTDQPLDTDNGSIFVCSPRSWFLAVAIPKIYEKHTELKYSRSFNTEHNSSGKPHDFSMQILTYFDDFTPMTDTALNSAIPNYQKALKKNADKNLKEYEWPYNWTSYRTT